MLTPLTSLIGSKKTFQWGPEQDKAFPAMKAKVAADTLLAYLNHNHPFDIETDTSGYQLGSIIKQDGQPVAYYSRKLNSAQQNYMMIKKELLSVVKTLKTFHSMLLGASIMVHMDPKNLTHKVSNYTTQCMLHWHLLLIEFGTTYKYKTGLLMLFLMLSAESLPNLQKGRN